MFPVSHLVAQGARGGNVGALGEENWVPPLLGQAVQHKVGRSSQEIPRVHHPLRGGSERPPEREGYQESPTEAKKTLIEQCFQEGVINTSIHGEQCSSAMFY